MTKEFYKSKRFWVGLTALVTGVGMIVTGDKSFNEVLPELILTVLGLIQAVLGLTTNTPITVGGVVLGKRS